MPSDPVVAQHEMARLLTARAATSRDPRWFTYGDRVLEPGDIVGILDPYLTAERRRRIEAVLDHRTYNLVVAVEGMVDTGNVSAIMRTADGFGVQEFHAIDTAGSYKHSKRTSQGTEKWLDRYRWRAPAECIAALHAGGRRVVAAHVDAAATPIEEMDFSAPTALLFGNERSGLSAEALAMADEVAVIPIGGFVQSFNISVAAGMSLYQARLDRIRRLGSNGDLPPPERDRLRAVFTIKSVKHARRLVERALGLDQSRSRPR